MSSKLSICTLLQTSTLAEALLQSLRDTPHYLTQFSSEEEFLKFIEQQRHGIDCLILEDTPALKHLLVGLKQRSVLLPTVILELTNTSKTPEQHDAIAALDRPPHHDAYHKAILHLNLSQLGQLEKSIDQAISKFLKLPPHPDMVDDVSLPTTNPDHSALLMPQQRRLAEKLKERLGYLGVYYKRNPKNFLRNLSREQRKDLLRQLKADYRDIILIYFSPDAEHLNDKIDNFVNMAFFADVSVSQIVEIHMELMDDFAKQLKLEGRSEEILLDYRLTLIDAIAHLCEMYRRSIPRDS